MYSLGDCCPDFSVIIVALFRVQYLGTSNFLCSKNDQGLDRPQLAECLLSMHKALGLISSPHPTRHDDLNKHKPEKTIITNDFGFGDTCLVNCFPKYCILEGLYTWGTQIQLTYN
jgi:hypothetical protein